MRTMRRARLLSTRSESLRAGARLRQTGLRALPQAVRPVPGDERPLCLPQVRQGEMRLREGLREGLCSGRVRKGLPEALRSGLPEACGLRKGLPEALRSGLPEARGLRKGLPKASLLRKGRL